MTKISVAIATRNEEKHIEDCLKSVSWADEIVIFDEKSGDKTVSIAKKYTAKIFSVNHEDMFHLTKQKAVAKCRHPWILQIDADERVTPELKRSILEVINSPDVLNGYQAARKSRIFGKWIEHTGWYPDFQVKLFRKGKGHFPALSLHEMIKIDGDIGTLQGDLLHEHYDSVDWFLNRLNAYTKNDAENILRRQERISWTDAISFPADEFFKRFFLWQGYRDGLHGLVLSLLMAFNRLVVFSRVWQAQSFWQYGDQNFLGQVISESKMLRRNWHHWLIQSSDRPLEKIGLRIIKKLDL